MWKRFEHWFVRNATLCGNATPLPPLCNNQAWSQHKVLMEMKMTWVILDKISRANNFLLWQGAELMAIITLSNRNDECAAPCCKCSVLKKATIFSLEYCTLVEVMNIHEMTYKLTQTPTNMCPCWQIMTNNPSHDFFMKIDQYTYLT